MSELMTANTTRGDVRRVLLASVSAAVLLAATSISNASAANEEGESPTVWIELGGQLERVDGGLERFAPPFTGDVAEAGLISPVKLERPARYSNGAEGKLTFIPHGSDWNVSAALRYGRSQMSRHLHQEKALPPQRLPAFVKYITATPVANFADTAAKSRESHAILDFQVGREVGIGVLGSQTKTDLAFGVRAVQFTSGEESTLYARPDSHFLTVFRPPFPLGFAFPADHNYNAAIEISRSFRGVGPSIAWNGSASLVGNRRDAEISFDWEINAAVLFGRQKMMAQHNATAHYRYATGLAATYKTPYQHTASTSRSRSVTVPNLGGVAGVSYRLQNFRLALGYRADLFFNAVDGGIDARKSYDRSFYGPFATISIGLP